jgi:hypothetical protein
MLKQEKAAQNYWVSGLCPEILENMTFQKLDDLQQ